MKEEPIQIPLVLTLDEVKTELVNAVNTALVTKGVPCWALEPIIGDIYRQIKAGSQRELEAARLQVKQTQSNQTVNKKEG